MAGHVLRNYYWIPEGCSFIHGCSAASLHTNTQVKKEMIMYFSYTHNKVEQCSIFTSLAVFPKMIFLIQSHLITQWIDNRVDRSLKIHRN